MFVVLDGSGEEDFLLVLLVVELLQADRLRVDAMMEEFVLNVEERPLIEFVASNENPLADFLSVVDAHASYACAEDRYRPYGQTERHEEKIKHDGQGERPFRDFRDRTVRDRENEDGYVENGEREACGPINVNDIVDVGMNEIDHVLLIRHVRTDCVLTFRDEIDMKRNRERESAKKQRRMFCFAHDGWCELLLVIFVAFGFSLPIGWERLRCFYANGADQVSSYDR